MASDLIRTIRRMEVKSVDTRSGKEEADIWDADSSLLEELLVRWQEMTSGIGAVDFIM